MIVRFRGRNVNPVCRYLLILKCPAQLDSRIPSMSRAQSGSELWEEGELSIAQYDILSALSVQVIFFWLTYTGIQ